MREATADEMWQRIDESEIAGDERVWETKAYQIFADLDQALAPFGLQVVVVTGSAPAPWWIELRPREPEDDAEMEW